MAVSIAGAILHPIASAVNPIRKARSRPGPCRQACPVPRRSRPAPRRDEVVQQPPELAPHVHVAVREDDQGQAPVGIQAPPDAPARHPERDQQANEQQPERRPDDPRPRVPLRDQQRVLPEAAQLHREVRALGGAGLAAGQRERLQARDDRRAVGVGAHGPERHHEQHARPRRTPAGAGAGARRRGPGRRTRRTGSRPPRRSSGSGRSTAACRPRPGSRRPARARTRSGGTCSPRPRAGR